MTRKQVEERWPNLEVFGPQWFRVLGMTSSTRSRLTRAKLKKIPRDARKARDHLQSEAA